MLQTSRALRVLSCLALACHVPGLGCLVLGHVCRVPVGADLECNVPGFVPPADRTLFARTFVMFQTSRLVPRASCRVPCLVCRVPVGADLECHVADLSCFARPVVFGPRVSCPRTRLSCSRPRVSCAGRCRPRVSCSRLCPARRPDTIRAYIRLSCSRPRVLSLARRVVFQAS